MYLALRPCTASLTGAAVAALVGCASLGGSPSPQLVTGRDVPPASGAPKLDAIRDLGRADLGGALMLPRARSDGEAVIGELIVLTGKGFGRGPRVTVDTRTAEQLARTADGGIVVRVPWGVRTGKREITVITRYGQDTRLYAIRRHALATVPSADRVVVLRVTATGLAQADPPMMLPNAQLVRFSAEGDLALVSGMTESGALTLSAIDMLSPKGPRLLTSFSLPGERIIALMSARHARVAYAVTNTHIVSVDLSAAHPGLGAQHPLPAELAEQIVGADIDPKGQRMALLLRPNDLQLYDLASAGAPVLVASTQVLPQTTVPLVHNIRYGADAETIWVTSGDNLRSADHPSSPLRLTVIRIQQQEHGRALSFGLLSVWRTIDVPHRAAPVDLAIAHGQPEASGRAVAIPPKNAAVFITAHDATLLRLRNARLDRHRGLRRAVRILRSISTHVGTVVRTDSEGSGGPVFRSPSLLGAIDITSDSQLLLVAGAKVEVTSKPPAIRLIYGVTVSRVWGDPRPQFIGLGDVDPETLHRPFSLGDVRVQP